MDLETAQRATRRVGAITAAIGATLVIAPTQAGRVLRLDGHDNALRAIGVADLVLVPGLLAGRHQKRWMAARAGLNLGIAAYCLRLARQEGSTTAKVAVLAMVAATVADGRTFAALHRADSHRAA
ncbi:hypothetical protein CLV63_13343 [Murinocardiopsis flavida]|uniref:Uncharacterized protein n=1 Tax=Murinocardiopsis flavida TaxID=645275 RepID=A0A2P8CPN2_9ACTN|nr:hypothetical protein [Murinocardiopsis flavida]PSK86926.1 hypothetical protein CLV63_13343 [Murinocardiopsis flavida]